MLINFYKEKDKNYNPVILLNILLFSFLILSSFRSIPDSTHYLASFFNIENVKDDKVNQIVLFIKTPVYFFLNYIFQSPLLYSVTSIVINFILINLVYFITLKLTQDELASFLSTAFIIFLKFLLLVGFFLNIEIIESITYLLINSDLLNFFTVRQLFGAIFILSIYFFLKENYFFTIILIFLNNFTHPNSNIFCILIFFIYLLYISLKNFKNLKYLIGHCLLNTIFLFFLFLKVKTFDIEDNLNINNFYYDSLIKDEADDFSFMWTFAYRFYWIIIVTLIHLINIAFYLKNKYWNQKLVFLTVLPIILYFFGFLIEYLNLYLRIELINNLIINTQPGWKLLGYSFIPSLLILAFNIKSFINLKYYFYKKFIFYFTYLTIFLFLIFGFIRNYNELKNFYIYAFKNINTENNYEVWLESYNYENEHNYFAEYIDEPIKIKNEYTDLYNIYDIKKFTILNNDNNYKVTKEKVGLNLINFIKDKVPKGNGLILPPHMMNARGIFKDYKVYFNEHPDGNFAMGNKKFFIEINNRMMLLLGKNYKSFPNKRTRLNYSYLRNLFHDVDENILINIKNNYPLYSYFITDSEKKINIELIGKIENFKIYKF